MTHEVLAFYMPYGKEDSVTEYRKKDMQDPDIVKQLFDYCQILEGHITYSGWLFLIKYYGYEKLHEIDKMSKWFDSESLEEFIENVNLEIRMVNASENDPCKENIE